MWDDSSASYMSVAMQKQEKEKKHVSGNIEEEKKQLLDQHDDSEN